MIKRHAVQEPLSRRLAWHASQAAQLLVCKGTWGIGEVAAVPTCRATPCSCCRCGKCVHCCAARLAAGSAGRSTARHSQRHAIHEHSQQGTYSTTPTAPPAPAPDGKLDVIQYRGCAPRLVTHRRQRQPCGGRAGQPAVQREPQGQLPRHAPLLARDCVRQGRGEQRVASSAAAAALLGAMRGVPELELPGVRVGGAGPWGWGCGCGWGWGGMCGWGWVGGWVVVGGGGGGRPRAELATHQQRRPQCAGQLKTVNSAAVAALAWLQSHPRR